MKELPYSLWLLPAPTARNELADLIENLSRRLGTPRFEPHVTLVASVETDEAKIIASATAIAASLAPITVHFEGIGQTDAYYRCLFLRAAKRADLLAAHRHACARLGSSPEPDFMPHLSLVYGKLERAVKEKLTEEIAGRCPATLLVDRLGICVVDGSPDTWQVIGPYRLTGAGA